MMAIAQPRRAEHRSNAKQQRTRFKNYFSKMQTRSDAGKWTSQSVVHQIEKALPRVYVLTAQVKKELAKGLETAFEVCHCVGESDTCIAGAIKFLPTMTVAERRC